MSGERHRVRINPDDLLGDMLDHPLPVVTPATADPAWYAKSVIATSASWEAAIARFVGEGATDDEILAGASIDMLTIPERREIEAKLRAARGAVPRKTDGPTDYARTMIPKVSEAYRFLARSSKRRTPSMAATARKAEVDRDTIAGWIKRGWMTWPPV